MVPAGWLAPAWAEQPGGFYVGAGAGFNYTESQPTRLDLSSVMPGLSSASPATRPISLGAGFAVLGTAGYALGNGARLEVEGNVRRNGADRVSGSELKYGLFANALFDADLGLSWVTPFAGAGVGFAVVDQNNVTVRSAVGGASFATAGTAVQLAYQGIIGAAFPVPGVARLSVTAEYHYARTAGSRRSGVAAQAPAANRVRIGDDASHTMVVGLRYGLGAPAPADEDVATSLGSALAPPPRSYVVYFDANSTALSARALDVIAQAARASARLTYTRIEVSGHTDRSNAAASNAALAKARADAVADELVRWGIVRDTIEVHAFGDEKPLAVAAAGVSEPRNRRVEILYR